MSRAAASKARRRSPWRYVARAGGGDGEDVINKLLWTVSIFHANLCGQCSHSIERNLMQACCPYLFFNGDAEQAMKLYQTVLGGEMPELLRYSQQPAGEGAPPGCEPSDPNRVMHAYLTFPGGALMASDAPNPAMFEPMKGMSVNLMLPEQAAAKKVFDQLTDGAEVRMPFGPTFWADGFGMLVDRFGTPWMISGGMRAPDVQTA
ncbi:MAG: VOC family protein [Rubrivivax sp.]|nr:MAG: VOC family protein [Rubrivivax sp.]